MPAPSAPLSGAVTFKFDRAALTPALIARDFKGVVQFQSPEIALRDLDGKLAGGRLTGGLTFRRDPQAFAAQGHVELAGANAAAIFAPNNLASNNVASNNNAIDGVLTAKVQGESQGLSPEAIVGAFHGGGTIALSRSQFAGINPAAFDAAIHAGRSERHDRCAENQGRGERRNGWQPADGADQAKPR